MAGQHNTGQVSSAMLPHSHGPGPGQTPDTAMSTLSTSLSTAFIEWDQQPAAVVWLRCCPAPPLPTNNNNCEFDLQRCVRVLCEHYQGCGPQPATPPADQCPWPPPPPATVVSAVSPLHTLAKAAQAPGARGLVIAPADAPLSCTGDSL